MISITYLFLFCLVSDKLLGVFVFSIADCFFLRNTKSWLKALCSWMELVRWWASSIVIRWGFPSSDLLICQECVSQVPSFLEWSGTSWECENTIQQMINCKIVVIDNKGWSLKKGSDHYGLKGILGKDSLRRERCKLGFWEWWRFDLVEDLLSWKKS